jgi:hypothetical protein
MEPRIEAWRDAKKACQERGFFCGRNLRRSSHDVKRIEPHTHALQCAPSQSSSVGKFTESSQIVPGSFALASPFRHRQSRSTVRLKWACSSVCADETVSATSQWPENFPVQGNSAVETDCGEPAHTARNENSPLLGPFSFSRTMGQITRSFGHRKGPGNGRPSEYGAGWSFRSEAWQRVKLRAAARRSTMSR